jgi:hypothetical protein
MEYFATASEIKLLYFSRGRKFIYCLVKVAKSAALICRRSFRIVLIGTCFFYGTLMA